MNFKLKDEKKELWRFGISAGIALFILSLILFLKHNSKFIYSISASIIFLSIGLLRPLYLKPIHFILSKIWFGISQLITKLVLIIAYYLIFTPIGLLMRVVKKDQLAKKIDKKAKTYWLNKDLSSDSLDYRKMF
ncbi:hypothetical protein KKC91_03465 [bacterium]|nr:hypothetical protein [bacterium]